MVATGLRDQDKLNGASNFGMWKVKMAFLLNEFGLKEYAENIIVMLIYPQ